MEKKVYCITNNQGLFYNKSNNYIFSEPPFTSNFNTLFTLYMKHKNAQNVVDKLNRTSNIAWEVKEVTLKV